MSNDYSSFEQEERRSREKTGYELHFFMENAKVASYQTNEFLPTNEK